MSRTYLAIHVDSCSIKLVYATRTFHTNKILDTKIIHAPEDQDPQTIAQVISDSIEELHWSAEMITLCLSSQFALWQRLTFPFSQAKKIIEVLPLEIENSLPVQLSLYSWDYWLLPNPSQEQTDVYVALVKKAFVHKWIEAFEQKGHILKQVGLDLGVLATLTRKCFPKQNVMLLELGWETTNVAWQTTPSKLFLRSIPLGIKHIFHDFELLHLPDDEQILARSFQEHKNDPDHSMLPYHTLQFFRQIKLTIMSMNPEILPETIILCGGPPLLTPLDQLLEKELGPPTSVIKDLPWLSQESTVNPVSSLAIASTLACSSSHSKEDINLRPDELASHHHSSYWKQHFRFGIIALSSLLLAWILSICSECYIYTKQINQLEQRLDQEFYALFPEMSDAIHPLQYPSIITSKISQMQKGGQSNRVSRVTTLQILSVISEDLSSNLDLQVEFLSLDQNQIRLNGQAQDFKTIDTVKKRLELNKLFTQVQILGANVDKRTKKVNFSLRLFTATV